MKWKKCSEELPEFYKEVLVVFSQKDKQNIGLGQRKQFPQCWDIIGCGTFPRDDVEYWMYLPEFPRLSDELKEQPETNLFTQPHIAPVNEVDNTPSNINKVKIITYDEYLNR